MISSEERSAPVGDGSPRRPLRPAGPTRSEVVSGVRRELELAGLESPRVEAERLVAAGLGVERAELAAAGGERMAPGAAARVARAVSRRLAGQPLQHIEGTVDFRRARLVSDGRALIPRPETEQLLDLVAAWRERRGAPAGRALDIGVGSGAIALALLEEEIAERVLGLDVSAEALALARANAGAAGRADGPAPGKGDHDRLELRRCTPAIWPALGEGERFDLIVSNPPYVPSAEWAALEPQVRDHEPRAALDGGPDGLDVIRTIIGGAGRRLRPGGALFLEIGADQGPVVLALLREAPHLADAAVRRDLSGRPRFARAGRA